MDDRDVAGNEIRQLRQKQGRAQFVRQPLDQHARTVVGLQHLPCDLVVDGNIAFTCRRRPRSFHAIEKIRIARRRIVDGQTCRIDPEPLPGFHLALVAALCDLFRQVELDHREWRRAVSSRSRTRAAALSKACQFFFRSSPSEETIPMPVIQTS
ncbi:MAG: hypothetical protein H6877_07565 [Rhodobiaceae bacterium]|nr:hypothetical protein [Rhodobiaceae bacterium]